MRDDNNDPESWPGGRQWIKTEIRIYQKGPQDPESTRTLIEQHNTPSEVSEPVCVETYETDSYILTYVASKSRARWRVIMLDAA